MSDAPLGGAIGIDIGGSKILGLVIAHNGTVRSRLQLPTPKDSIEDLLAALTRIVEQLDEGDERLPLGIGLPGMIGRGGTVAFSPHLPATAGLDPAVALCRLLGDDREIVIENDANCALLAEHRLGAAQGIDDVVMITLGTGIGGALMSDGTLRRGANGFAGEVGHMVLAVDGPPCPCGAKGCWERYASGSGLARLARDAAVGGRLRSVTEAIGGDPKAVRGEDVTAAAALGDPEAQAVVDEAGWWLARGIANVVCVIDPELVVLGGGMSAAALALLPSATRHLGELLEGSQRRPKVELAVAELGADAGAIGAALLGRDGI